MELFERILEAKFKSGLGWDEIARKAGIGVSTWMTGIPCCTPSDRELKKVAPVLGTTYEWLKYGKQEH